MIKITNHLFKDSLKENYLLNKFEYIVFETTNINLVLKLIQYRFSDPNKFKNIDFKELKYEKIKDFQNGDLEKTLFISKYQILWDEFILRNMIYQF
jgi:hypothetical protein